MLTVAYLANQFPVAVEPYVTEEIEELRRLGIRVITGSVARVSEGKIRDGPDVLLRPVGALVLAQAIWMCLWRWNRIANLIARVLFHTQEGPIRRVKALLHTVLGACYAVRLSGLGVEHIHVHHGFSASWIAMAAARLLDLNFSLTLHGSDLLLHRAYLDVKLRNCALCLTVSEYNRRFIAAHYPDIELTKVVVARLGVEIPETGMPISTARRSNAEPLRILAVGRLHVVKDHAFLVRACAYLRDQDLDFHCEIAGEGPERRRLESLIAKLGLENRVTLLGHIQPEQTDSLYTRADVVVLTSRSEGIPLVLMEAMARGKLVVAPAITGIPELVIAGNTGFLYQPGSMRGFLEQLTEISCLLAHETYEKWGIQDVPSRPNPNHSSQRLDWVRHAARVQVRHREPTPYDRHFVPHIDFKGQLSWQEKVRGAVHVIYSTEARRRIRAMIKEFRPDVAHLRSIYHHLSPSILWELRAQNIPILYHLNDFKILCPNYNFVSRGLACEMCKGGAFWQALRTRCYPGAAARATLVAEAYVHRWLGTYRKCVDRFLAPSRFVRDKFVEHGWNAELFEVLPHFQNSHAICEPPKDGPILYFGRLSAEKGVDDLIRAMPQVPHVDLVIAGDGPQRNELERLAIELRLGNVKFAGHLGPEERDRQIARSRFTVLPSRAYETLGKTILESYAHARPVIASDIGSRRELLHDGETGLLYRAGNVNQLAETIHLLALNPDLTKQMGRAGWEMVRRDHTPERHYQRMMCLYDQLLAAKPKRSRPIVCSAERGRALKPRIRVAFIGGRGVISKYSGIESYYEEVGKRLVAMGHEVTVYCRTHFTPDLAEHNGMKLVRLPTVRSKHLETLIHTSLSTLHALTHRYHLVHYHALGPALFSFLPRLVGVKTAVTVQGLDWQRKKWGRFASAVLRLGERASVQFPDGTMVVSCALQSRYRAQHGVEAFYVPNGGMLRERKEPRAILEWGLQPGGYVLFLGRFSPEKGCHLLVEAFEQIATDAKLVMAGASSYCDEYSRELRTHASERIQMLEWVSGETLDELLTNAMIFVLPSDLEGLSLALLDAMGAGLCVLTSDVPENREVVDGAGFTFQRGNASNLADRLRFLIANPSVREAAGRIARKKIEDHYQWQKIAQDIESAYLGILGGQPVTAINKKPSSAATTAGEDLPLGRRAG